MGFLGGAKVDIKVDIPIKGQVKLTISIGFIFVAAFLIPGLLGQTYLTVFYATVDWVKNNNLMMLSWSLVLGLIWMVLISSSEKFKNSRLEYFLSPAQPMILLFAIILCLLASSSFIFSFGRIGEPKIALVRMGDIRGMDGYHNIEASISTAIKRVKTLKRHHSIPFVSPVIGTSSLSLRNELEKLRAENYDIVVIDHPLLSEALTDGGSSQIINPYTLYISTHPVTSEAATSLNNMISASPDILTYALNIIQPLYFSKAKNIRIFFDNSIFGTRLNETVLKLAERLQIKENFVSSLSIERAFTKSLGSPKEENTIVWLSWAELPKEIKDCKQCSFIAIRNGEPFLTFQGLTTRLDGLLSNGRGSLNTRYGVRLQDILIGQSIEHFFTAGRPLEIAVLLKDFRAMMYHDQHVRFLSDGRAVYPDIWSTNQ